MFIILASRRSGTHMLASLLNSHPDLRCYDEIFLSPKWKLKLGRKELTKLEKNEGCIVMYRHFLRLGGELRGLITRSKVIHPMRRNLDNHALSYARNNGSTKKEIEYRKREIIGFRKLVFSNQRQFPHLFEIYYEDICQDKDIKEYENEKLLIFLGASPGKLTTNLTKGKDP
jgi:hypothetical protein